MNRATKTITCKNSKGEYYILVAGDTFDILRCIYGIYEIEYQEMILFVEEKDLQDSYRVNLKEEII